MNEDEKDVQSYLARIRKTIEESRNLVSQAELRIAETDRMLEKHGLTREQVMAMHFSEAQIEAANAELKRRGMDPLEMWGEMDRYRDAPEDYGYGFRRDAQNIGQEIKREAGGESEFAERQRKFGLMMKPFQL